MTSFHLHPNILCCALLLTTEPCIRAENTAPPRSSASDSRGLLAEQVDRNVAEGTRTMAAVTAQAGQLDAGTRAELLALAEFVRSAEHRLRRSLRTLQNASAEEWPRARATFAASYETYAQAVAQAEQLVATNASLARNSD